MTPTVAEHAALRPPTPDFPWPTLPVDPARLQVYLDECVRRGIRYGLGAKADAGGRSLAAFPPAYPAIDCSGWVRAALAYAGGFTLPDGSVNQHDWVASHGFKRSAYPALLRRDSLLRIAFLAPSRLHPVGHVYLCRDGRTLESYGCGPGSRSPLAHVLSVRTTSAYVLG